MPRNMLDETGSHVDAVCLAAGANS